MQVTIEKMIYGGDGLARLPDPADPRRGKAVFVPFVLEGERVEAAVVEERPGFVRARAEQVLEPSPQRAEPRCPYFLRCGGCHYQHTGYEHQLEIKTAILRETLRRTAKLEWPGEIAVHASPPWNYRNRTRLRVRGGADFALGYNRFGSQELLPVEECPISSPLINQAIAKLWELGLAGRVGAGVREVEFFADRDDARLQVEIYATPEDAEKQRSGDAYALVELLWRELPERAGIYVVPGEHADIPRWGWMAESDFLYRTARADYRVSAGSFFQTNRHMTDELVGLVTEGRSGRLALDLYAGVGLFAAVLARSFQRVMAVEPGPASYADLEENAPENVKKFRATTENFLRKHPDLRADYVVVDPPRAGLGRAVTQMLAQMAAPRLTYVSCDPSTAARDLQRLLESGYRVERIHLVDLFPQTYHIESVFELVR